MINGKMRKWRNCFEQGEACDHKMPLSFFFRHGLHPVPNERFAGHLRGGPGVCVCVVCIRMNRINWIG